MTVTKQPASTSGTIFTFDTGSIASYRPLIYQDNLTRYPVFYLESKDLPGDLLMATVCEPDSTVNTSMIRTFAEMSYALEGNIMADITAAERAEVYQGLIWQELQVESREDRYTGSSGNAKVAQYMSDVFNLARTNVDNNTDLLPTTTLTVDETRAVYDRSSSGYIYYGPVTVNCEQNVNLSINYSNAGAVAVDRIGGSTLSKLVSGTNFYMRFDKDKPFTNFTVDFTTKVTEQDVIFLTTTGSRANLIAIMPTEKTLTGTLAFESLNNKATITVKKEPPVSGFEYTVYTPEGVKIASATTNASGVATFNAMELGNYVVKETKRPDYYTADETEYPVTLSANGDNVVVNTSSVRQLGYIKISAMEGLSPVVGCKYLVKNVGSTEYSQEVSVNGEETIEVPLGTYEITEIASNSLYELNTDTFTVVLGTEGLTQEVVVPKILATSFAEFQPTGYTGNITADLLNQRGDKLTSLTLTGNSRIGLAPETYSLLIKESGDMTPVASSIPFTVTAGQTTTIPITFNQASSKVTFMVKFGSYAVQNVTMEIRDISGRTVGSITTNSEGQAFIQDLSSGTYMAYVTATPSDRNYNRPATPFIFEGVDLTVNVNLQETGTAGIGSSSGSNSSSSSSNSNSSSSSSGGSAGTSDNITYMTNEDGTISAVDNRYPTLEPNQEIDVDNPFPTIDSGSIVTDGTGSNITNNSGTLPKTGLEDYIQVKHILASLTAVLVFIMLMRIDRRKEELA